MASITVESRAERLDGAREVLDHYIHAERVAREAWEIADRALREGRERYDAVVRSIWHEWDAAQGLV